jgi:ADP-ribosyl-[dinitrogen reductase] hydrolase
MTEDEILKRYGRKGMLTHLPAKQEARLAVLAWLARPFQAGVDYREAEVNALLGGHEIDYATLRRYLVDYGFLTRAAGIYRLAPDAPAASPAHPAGLRSDTASPAHSVIPADRFLGCLLGLAVGDAVGTTVEFKPRGSFPPVVEMTGGGPFALPKGAWTDDTSLALCLATSLLACGGFDARDQMDRYVRWHREGYLSSTGRCFDIGGTTSAALARYARSGDPFSGATDPHSAGNGSIMRLAPVPMFFATDPAAAIAQAAASSRTTHAAAECEDACRLFAAILLAALAGADKETVLFGPHAARELLPPLSPKIAALAAGDWRDKEIGAIRGSGYVVESLEAALWCFWRTDSYRAAILAAANLGDDADTTAAVCGQLAGAFYGVRGIPGHWLQALVMGEEIRVLALGLMRGRAGDEVSG